MDKNPVVEIDYAGNPLYRFPYPKLTEEQFTTSHCDVLGHLKYIVHEEDPDEEWLDCENCNFFWEGKCFNPANPKNHPNA